MNGYLVTFRIVKRSHDHRVLTIWVPHADEDVPNLSASSPEQAKSVARARLESATEVVGDGLHTEPVRLGTMVSIDDVVAIDAAVALA